MLAYIVHMYMFDQWWLLFFIIWVCLIRNINISSYSFSLTTKSVTYVWLCCVCVHVLSHIRLFATPWTLAYQAPLSMEFSRQEYWNGLAIPYIHSLLCWNCYPKNKKLDNIHLFSEHSKEVCCGPAGCKSWGYKENKTELYLESLM